MRVLGVDPSLRSTGWAVIEGDRASHRVVEYGIIRTREGEPLEDSLDTIAGSLEDVIGRLEPEELAIEDIFTARNIRVALTLGHVRGVVIFICRRRGMAVTQHSATRIKETVAGYGRAAKEQVAHMVCRTLRLACAPPPDAADAMAAALTRLFWQPNGGLS